MKKRLITAALLAVLYLGLIIPALAVNPIFYDVLVLVFMFTASYEMIRVISNRFAAPIKPCVYTQVVFGYVVFRVANFYGQDKWGISAMFASLVIMLVVCFVYSMISKRTTVANVLSTLLIMVYPLSLLGYLLAINYLGVTYRSVGIVFAFGVTSLVDSMALFVGSIFKGPKLAPTVSPKKTISGAIGGLVGGILGGLALYFLCKIRFLGLGLVLEGTWQNVLLYCFVGLGVSVACQAGDLIASYIKRYCNVKDYSNILPGHGGFMDRIDGVLVAGIFIFAFFWVFKIIF
jgi:phosphatidate cytidylyltransferase